TTFALKKSLKIGILGVLLATLLTLPHPTKAFGDISQDHQYAPAIGYLVANGIIKDSGDFQPDRQITLADFAEWLLMGNGFDGDGYTIKNQRHFTDLPLLDDAAPFIYRLLETGFFHIERSSKRARPTRGISRVEAIKLLFSIDGIPASRIINKKTFGSYHNHH
ncbi:MAG: S-layer homology domain-containing protein, partial [Bacteroidetes bacterium]|nr:S-layer homology domain-containing protein [Bacteroidota bacterium]